MTGMEQSLRYIEREIRFMVKDQYGNSTYAKYADRVIEDACGIPNFCTTVLSSKRPLSVILRAVRGPRGDVIMRFFNVSLHDARIEMVMVLAEAIKLRIHRNRSSRDAYEYLMKLYRKAIKRTLRLITGSKNKESYKSMYRGLRDFANMDDFDYDDDDDDYFDDGTEFGDSEFAEECLDAYRNGITPPEMKSVKPTILNHSMGLDGNDEILKEIASIENKLGRHLTDAELDAFLCGDDEDEDADESLYPKLPLNLINKDSDKMMDTIVESLYERLLNKLIENNLIAKEESNTAIDYESLDDFISKHKGIKPSNNEDSVNEFNEVSDKEIQDLKVRNPKSEDSKMNDSLENLVGMRNQLKNKSSDEESSDDSEESNGLPPNDSLGGNYDDETDIIVDNNIDEEDPSDQCIVSENDTNEIESTGNLIASDTDTSLGFEKNMIIGDIMKDFDRIRDLNAELGDKITNYLYQIGIEVIDKFITLKPSKNQYQLLTLAATIRVKGDYAIIDKSRLDLVVEGHVDSICKILDIDSRLIDVDFKIVDSHKSFLEELQCFHSDEKEFSPFSIDCFNLSLCIMVKYVYDRLHKMISIKYINFPGEKRRVIYFFNKDDSPINIDDEIGTLITTEMLEGGTYDEILDNFAISKEDSIEFEYVMGGQLIETFYTTLQDIIKNNKAIKDMIFEYSKANSQFIIDHLSSLDKPGCVISEPSFACGDGNVIIDNMYYITSTSELSIDEKKRLKSELSINGEYRIQLKELLSAISDNIEVSPYLSYKVEINDSDIEEEITEPESEPKTNNFGI